MAELQRRHQRVSVLIGAMFSSLSRRDPAGAGACEPEPCVRQRSPKNPAALAVRREAEEDWGGKHGRAGGVSELANGRTTDSKWPAFFETTVGVFLRQCRLLFASPRGTLRPLFLESRALPLLSSSRMAANL